MTTTALADLQVVDLGTKKAGALDVFIKRHKLYFPEQQFDPARCLGVDYTDRYKPVVEHKGYQFSSENVYDFDFPEAEYYLAFDFLEHLKNIEDSKAILMKMIQASTKGVWVRMPSFEDDQTNIKQLTPHGLRFTWTTWSYHPAHLQRKHVKQVVKEAGLDVRFKANMKIRRSTDARIVPDKADRNAVRYTVTQCGPKPDVKFDPPLVGQWEALIRKT